MARSKVRIPHLDYPFRFHVDGHAAVVEQDSEADVVNCALAIIKCPLGFRTELPDFGLTDQALNETINEEEIKSALELWEDRADYIILADEDAFDALVKRVQVEMTMRGRNA